MADVVLPAISFAEHEGSFTNMERRVQRISKAIITAVTTLLILRALYPLVLNWILCVLTAVTRQAFNCGMIIKGHFGFFNLRGIHE